MRISLRIAEHVDDPLRRGLATEIANECDVERHTAAAWLNNKAKYISLEALGRVADYLVRRYDVDKRTLPGALFAADPEHVWEALSGCSNLNFCIGTRVSDDWPGSDYVMTSDALLLGQMLSQIAHMVYETSTRQVGKTTDGKVESKGDQQAGGGGTAPSVGNVNSAKRSEESAFSHPIYPEFHLVEAPVRNSDPSHPGDNWEKLTGHATQLYEQLRGQPASAILALGSIKSNPMVELILARTFLAEAFSHQDNIARPTLRKCPILFRYRDDDPKPPSCCGGLKLAKNKQAPLPGIYFETKDGSWDGCTWDPASSDVAFLAYAYRPNARQVEVACGGFSARATRCLTRKLQQIIGSLGEPQYISKLLQVGMYLIEITFDPKDTNYSSISDNRDFEFQVIRLDEDVLKRRLEV